MKANYRFEIDGLAADGQTWTTKGDVASTFVDVFEDATRASFKQLTGGRAVFGKPGVGCNGPYMIRRILIERID